MRNICAHVKYPVVHVGFDGGNTKTPSMWWVARLGGKQAEVPVGEIPLEPWEKSHWNHAVVKIPLGNGAKS